MRIMPGKPSPSLPDEEVFAVQVDEAVHALDRRWRRFLEEGEVVLKVEAEPPAHLQGELVPLACYGKPEGIPMVILFAGPILRANAASGRAYLREHLLDLLEHELMHHLGLTDEQITVTHQTRLGGDRRA